MDKLLLCCCCRNARTSRRPAYIRKVLERVRQRYAGQPGSESIVLAPEVSVVYDKEIGLMDAARQAGLRDVSIARLRGI